MVIFDRQRQKIAEFRSSDDFNAEVCYQLTHEKTKPYLTYQYYSNDDDTDASEETEHSERQNLRVEDKSVKMDLKKFLIPENFKKCKKSMIESEEKKLKR